MPASKKRKLSGLSGLRLRAAYNSLLQLKESIVVEKFKEDSKRDPNEPALEGFVQQVDTMLALLGSKLEGPQVCLELCDFPSTHPVQLLTFSSMTMNKLFK